MKLGLVYHNAFDYTHARQTYQEAFAYWRLKETVFAQAPQSLQPAPHALRLLAEEPVTLDTTRHLDDESGVVLQALFSGLVQKGPKMEILPDVAQDWDLLEGGRVYLFHLHPQARWSDGQPVKAVDFVAAWRRFLAPGNPGEMPELFYVIRGAQAYHQGRRQPESLMVKALDESTLLVELNDPCGYFLSLLATVAACPIPAHQIAKFGEAWSQPEHLVTNGAFRLVSWDPGKSMRLVRNPNYHGSSGGNVQDVVLSFVQPWNGGLELYAQDRLDMLDIGFFQPQDLDAARRRFIDDYHWAPRLATGFTGFDTSRPPFDDLRVRRAFAMATDRQALAISMRGDHVLPASGGFIPPGMAGHTGGIALPFDPQKAQNLLAEAGYPGGRGFPVTLSVIPGVRAADVVAQFILEQWQQILNVRVRVEARPVSQSHASGEAHRPHLFNYAWNANFSDPAWFLQASSPLLQTHWRDNTYATLIEQARQCLDQEQRMGMYAQAERILAEAAPLIPLFYMRSHLLIKSWVRQFSSREDDGNAWKDIVLEPHP
jgi:oligopeptide transport system substrate-binding protein